MTFDNGENNGYQTVTPTSDRILKEAERCIRNARFKHLSAQFFTVAQRGLIGYGQGITAIPANHQELLGDYDRQSE